MTTDDRLLRDPAESALNDVARRCHEAAHLYRDAAARAEDPSVRELFHELATERRAVADALDEAVRAQGALPEAPDPDADTFHRLANAARAALATSPDRALLRDRAQAESELAEALEAALREDLPADLRRRLERLRRGADSAHSRLEACAEAQEA